MPDAERTIVSSSSPRPFRYSRAFAPRTPQTILKKRGRAHMHVAAPCGGGRCSLLRTGKRDLRHRHAQLLRQQPDGFRESNILDFLDEGKDISRLAAAKAVIKLPGGMDRKRSRLLGMKRTKPGEVLRPSLLQLDVVADDADDIRLLLERLFEVVGRPISHTF